jgi:aspartate aminotransferase-like enzyme
VLRLLGGYPSIGALDFCMEKWEVAVALTSSQKGSLPLPTGLGSLCIGQVG